MFSAEKRVKLSSRSINANDFSPASSIDHGIEVDESPVDFTDGDFSLPSVKRKGVLARKVSFSTNKQSFELSDVHHTSSGYSSLLSSSSLMTSGERSSHQRTPTKRKLEERDENVSPCKIRKKEPSDPNRAKRILKEKSSSENVLRSSTPIRSNTRTLLWGKSRSLHPQKFEPRQSLEEVGSFEKPPALPTSTEFSFGDVSGLEFTTSFDQINSTENQDVNIPPQFQQLMTSSMVEAIAKPKAIETKVESQSSTLSSSSHRRSYNGRVKLDILRKLNMTKDLALNQIFTYLSDSDLLSLSHVSKDYRNMIKSHKTFENRRLNYLKTHKQNLENKLPVSSFIHVSKQKAKDRKRAFGETNVNHSMQLRSATPPTSPSRKRLQENHNIVQAKHGAQYKCPSCQKVTAKINTIPIRKSPRKKKKRNVTSILKISTGRVQKRSKSFLNKPSIDSQCSSEDLFVTFPELDEHNSGASASSSCDSPASPSSEDSSSNEHQSSDIEMYEYAECTGKLCRFKFCTNCKEKYHPRQKCKELAPVSPSRGISFDSSGSCVNRSVKNSKRSLKRLIDIC